MAFSRWQCFPDENSRIASPSASSLFILSSHENMAAVYENVVRQVSGDRDPLGRIA